MEFKSVFISLLVAFVVALAFFSWGTFLNQKYVPLGGEAIDTGFYADFSGIQSYAGNLSTSVANTSSAGGVSSSASETTIVKSQSAFSILRSMIWFVPNLISSSAGYLGVPAIYASVAGWAFTFVFAITLVYLIFLGVKNFIG